MYGWLGNDARSRFDGMVIALTISLLFILAGKTPAQSGPIKESETIELDPIVGIG